MTFVRWAIAVEKVLNVCNYALFVLLFGPLRSVAPAAFHGDAGMSEVFAVWSIIVLTTVFSSITVLANTGITVAVERDWVTAIARGQNDQLTMLNTWMRRIDLFSKLVAPVSTCIWSRLTIVNRIILHRFRWLHLRHNRSARSFGSQLRHRVLVDCRCLQPLPRPKGDRALSSPPGRLRGITKIPTSVQTVYQPSNLERDRRLDRVLTSACFRK